MEQIRISGCVFADFRSNHAFRVSRLVSRAGQVPPVPVSPDAVLSELNWLVA